MRKAMVTLIALLLVISTLPGSSAQFVSFTTNDTISVLRGDYSTGTIQLTNVGGFSFKVVSYQSFWVEDSEGNIVQGFNLTVSPRIFSDWSPQKTYSLSYNISCNGSVEGGTYTLYLKFWAFTAGGSMYIVHAKVPLNVISEPLRFEVAEAYVKERPGSPYILNGENLVVFSHVINIGHSAVTINASVSFTGNGIVYFFENRTLEMAPGDNLVKFEIPVGYEVPEGIYRLEYSIQYDGDSYRYSREFQVKFGVRLVGLSLQADEVKLGEENRAYLTVLSERAIGVNLTVETYRDETPILKVTTPVTIQGGTDVLDVPLLTNVSGSITAFIKLTFNGRLIGEGNVSYTVLAPAVIRNVTYERLSDEEVLFKVTVLNPGEDGVDVILTYRITSGGKVLYKDSLQETLKAGVNEIALKFKLPLGEVVEYEFTLVSMDETSTSKGELYLQPPAPPTTTTATTTSPSNTTTTSGGNGSSIWWIVLVIMVFLLFIAGAFYYMRAGEKSKKRVRPKPKRRSPLGRFRRPKEPRFPENRELPKK
ncbi:hypothetical membrane protein, conserved [Thermococcus onnurineus NA1]|uniref:Hypothetical membrane protein, conserved n=1 Tax=Thermococcus onnurineus (strain NA1) TaxID=523850 RepID=B6YV37_THEON|nr:MULTISPECIES: hypothetical protein [Thermococcus]ACJ17265.1 hypothetical membrane protein, conserved [Thermococcus onnurineus NA1]NJE45994.1 hypothetical protein [Thermococcus sp. GR7]NJE78487.1 hypothetical protein [Thermococcus sp. GR4]NJF22190.1 hypothetical protein [Thermococcus sp. GR5]